MADSGPPTWEDIRGLIDRVDEVCRESESLRARAERALRRPQIWPDRRTAPHSYDEPGRVAPRDGDATEKGKRR